MFLKLLPLLVFKPSYEVGTHTLKGAPAVILGKSLGLTRGYRIGRLRRSWLGCHRLPLCGGFERFGLIRLALWSSDWLASECVELRLPLIRSSEGRSGGPVLWCSIRRGRGCEDHLGLVGCSPAHQRFNDALALAGILQLAEVPHDLFVIVPRIVVVVAADVWLALVLAPVRTQRRPSAQDA